MNERYIGSTLRTYTIPESKNVIHENIFSTIPTHLSILLLLNNDNSAVDLSALTVNDK